MKNIDQLPDFKSSGFEKLIQFEVQVTVASDSFLHIGGATNPISQKKASVFSIEDKPVIPASSFKGAFRNSFERHLIKNHEELLEDLNPASGEMLKPCIPSSRATAAENSLLSKGYRKYCEYKEEDRRNPCPVHGICPVCYFFGCGGLPGVLRIGNLFTDNLSSIINQTNIRLDRANQTGAHSAKVEGEQVKPGTIFKGTIEIIIGNKFHRFGEPRVIKGLTLDKWLTGIQVISLEERQLWLINQLLIPSLEAVTMLGGQRSKGAGKVSVELTD